MDGRASLGGAFSVDSSALDCVENTITYDVNAGITYQGNAGIILENAKNINDIAKNQIKEIRALTNFDTKC